MVVTQEMNTSVGSGNDLGNEQSCEWKRKEKKVHFELRVQK